MRTRSGFTLIELMIVVAIIAIIAAIAIPNLLSSRMNANETGAIVTLRNVSSAQAQFVSTSKADMDINGQGEFGTFQELAGSGIVRAGTTMANGYLKPAVISGAFRNVSLNGEVDKNGYYFKIYLPDTSGQGVCPDETGNYAVLDASLCETTWCAYAWPVNYGSSANRTFFVNQTGDIVTTDDRNYTGTGPTLPAHSAFIGGASNSITGLTAVGTTGGDGNFWKRVD